MKYFLAILFFCAPAFAFTADSTLPDPAQEARAQELFKELRCVVCAGESIAESPAEVASDMRRAVREAIAVGDNDATIRNMLVTQYGERVLMTPNYKQHVGLWLAPLFLLLVGALIAWRTMFRGSDA